MNVSDAYVEYIFPIICLGVFFTIFGMWISYMVNSKTEGCPCKGLSEDPKCDISYNCCSSRKRK